MPPRRHHSWVNAVESQAFKFGLLWRWIRLHCLLPLLEIKPFIKSEELRIELHETFIEIDWRIGLKRSSIFDFVQRVYPLLVRAHQVILPVLPVRNQVLELPQLDLHHDFVHRGLVLVSHQRWNEVLGVIGRILFDFIGVFDEAIHHLVETELF